MEKACKHEWAETGVKDNHVVGNMFKYGTPVVTYVRCIHCKQTGYRKPPSKVVYTWT